MDMVYDMVYNIRFGNRQCSANIAEKQPVVLCDPSPQNVISSQTSHPTLSTNIYARSLPCSFECIHQVVVIGDGGGGEVTRWF
jgi:hypothetical protein